MRRHIPTTRSLVVFDAVARHQSVSKAAEELSLTHSAVSQQIRVLEEVLGQPLFQRGARGVTLNATGEIYRAKVADALLRLEQHTLDVMALGRSDSSLLVGVLPVFADRWLLPRLPDFTRQHPTVRLQFQVFPTNTYMADPRFDIAIQYQDAAWPRARQLPLFAEDCIAVHANTAPFHQALAKRDFRRVPLLHLSSRLQAWSDWLQGAQLGHSAINPLAGHRFDLFSMIVEAALAGMGVGLVPRFTVQRELSSGALVQSHPHVQRGSQAYSLFVPAQREQDPSVMAFSSWLLEQCAANS